jgi:acetyl-CoA hydrolase
MRAEDVDFARYVRPGDTVVWGQACSEPTSLVEGLLAQRARIGRFRCFLGLSAGRTVGPEYADQVCFVSYTGHGANRALYRAGELDILPCHYSQLPSILTGGALAADVVLVQLSPPDAGGRHSFGLGVDYLPAVLARARVVIAEVNRQVPWTEGPTVPAEALDVVVTSDRPPVEYRRPEVGGVQRRIAVRVAELVEDEATLQLGLGAVPDAVLGALAGHRDLGVHSGQIGDGVAELMRAGVITNARKTLDAGRTVAGLLMGSARLFGFAEDNPAIVLRETGYTHDLDVLAAQERFVAVNSAIEVDLSGQVNAEMAGADYVGAVGGAVDFLRGAGRSRGGLPVVALPSTAGRRSRIVARLGGPVSTARSDAGVVVTEFGVADLRGLPLGARRDRLIAIAHPDHRAALDAGRVTEEEM